LPTKNRDKLPATGPTICNPEAVHQAVNWLLTGATDRDVKDAVETKYGPDKTQDIMAAAYAFCRQHAHPDPDTVRGWGFLALRELYRRQLETGDFASALRTIRELIALADN